MFMDLTGKRIGKLTIEEPTDQRKNGYIVWKCQCDCGKEIFVDYRKLMRGTAKDCGCDSVQGKLDLRGKRFGKLVAISDTGKSSAAGRIWFCQCDCGGTIEAPSGQLVKGFRKSCGCLSKPHLKEYVGRQFGELTVIRYSGKKKGSHIWHCRCSCGKELDVRQSNLQSGHTKSCGCKNDIKNNIHFVDGTSIEAIRSEKIIKSNTSGVRGVYWSKKSSKWIAQITFQRKTIYLGSFLTLEEAAKVRKLAEEKYFGEFLKWYDGWKDNE